MQKPDRKIGAGGIGGAVAVIVVWMAGLLGADVPPEVAAAFATVGGFVTGYVVKS